MTSPRRRGRDERDCMRGLSAPVEPIVDALVNLVLFGAPMIALALAVVWLTY